MKKIYQDDYRWIDTIKDGKIVSRMEYCGDYYQFLSTASDRSHNMKLFAVCALIMSVLFFLPLCFLTRLTSVPYILIPHAFLIIPIYFLQRALLLGRKNFLIHEEADKLSVYLPASLIACVLLSALTAAGIVIYALAEQAFTFSFTDLIFLAGDLILALIALHLYHHRNAFDMKTVPEISKTDSGKSSLL